MHLITHHPIVSSTLEMQKKGSVAYFFPQGTVPEWYTKVVGVFGSSHEASKYAEQCVDDEPQNTTFMVHPVGTWIACTDDDKWYKNVSEIASNEHNNPALGRHGSVVDIRKSNVQSQQPTETTTNLPPPSKTEKDITKLSHQARLEKLLTYGDGPIPNSSAKYRELMDQYAMLGAYTRGLLGHVEQSDKNIGKATDDIVDIEAEFPDYKVQCAARYRKALDESGIHMDETDDKSIMYHLMRDDA